MKRGMFAALSFAAMGALLLFAQVPRGTEREDPNTPRLKREQVEELLKSDHKKSLADTDQIIKLGEELKVELEKSDRHVLSVKAYKITEEIEKISKRIRGRMKRY
jgi:hypothetical protein